MQTESRLLLRLLKDEQGAHQIQDQLCRRRRISALLLIVSNPGYLPPSLLYPACISRWLVLSGGGGGGTQIYTV